jgi:O-antigen ligase
MIDRFMNPSQRDKLVSYAITFYFDGDLFNQLFGTTVTAYFDYAGKVTHNDQLRILINYGVINLIVYVLMYFILMIKIYTYTKRESIKENRIYAYFVLMMIFMYLFRGNFSNFFPALFIFYFIGSFYGMKLRAKELVC